MKILFICENYLPHIGGAEVVFKNLSERYVKLGHSVTVLTHRLPNTPVKEIINGIKVIRVRSFHSRYVFTFSSIWKAVRLARKHDIIQTTSFNGAPPAWLAGKIAGKPVIITVHEVWAGRWREITGFSWLKSILHEYLEQAIYFLPYHHYVCVSNATRRDLERLSLKKDKITTIYNGFDVQSKPKSASDIKKKFNLSDKFVYLSWGRTGPTKGFEYLIKAWPLIKKNLPQAVLVLILGEVKMHQDIKYNLLRLIEKLHLNDSVRVITNISEQDKVKFITSADCVIIPSTSEGFGYTTVEANALGVPVVASDAGSISEVISGKFLLFRNRDIEDLAAKALQAAKGEYTMMPLKTFSWDSAVKSYLGIYENLST